MTTRRRRPSGVTLLAIAGLLAALTSPVFYLLVGLYGVTALMAAIATWRMNSRMAAAFAIWSGAALALGAYFLLSMPPSLIWGGRLAAAAFMLGLAAALWAIFRFLRRTAQGEANVAL